MTPPTITLHPIATAPKDGTWILLFSKPHETVELAKGYWNSSWGGLWIFDAGRPFDEPTHWSPLPKLESP